MCGGHDVVWFGAGWCPADLVVELDVADGTVGDAGAMISGQHCTSEAEVGGQSGAGGDHVHLDNDRSPRTVAGLSV